MYHRLGEGRLSDREPGEHLYTVAPADFEAQLDALVSPGCQPVPLDAACAGAGAAMGPPVAITFDDGNASDHSVALPALARRGLTAAFFVTPGWVGRPGFMGWDEVRALAQAGMTVGAHGLEHVPLASLTRAELLAQLREARRVLEARLQAPADWLALPGGSGGRREVQVAREAGFRGVVGSVPRLASPAPSADPVPRFAIRNGQSLASFRALVRQGRAVRLRYWLRYWAVSRMRSVLGSRGHERLREAWLRLTP